MPPNGSAYVRLIFNPLAGNTVVPSTHSTTAAPSFSSRLNNNMTDVYLFLNDESGQNEECFLFKVYTSNL